MQVHVGCRDNKKRASVRLFRNRLTGTDGLPERDVFRRRTGFDQARQRAP
jgi:hypothetical protein